MKHFCCLLLAKQSRFTRFQCVKFFRPKIGSCKFFDKFQVWLRIVERHYVQIRREIQTAAFDLGTFSFLRQLPVPEKVGMVFTNFYNLLRVLSKKELCTVPDTSIPSLWQASVTCSLVSTTQPLSSCNMCCHSHPLFQGHAKLLIFFLKHILRPANCQLGHRVSSYLIGPAHKNQELVPPCLFPRRLISSTTVNPLPLRRRSLWSRSRKPLGPLSSAKHLSLRFCILQKEQDWRMMMIAGSDFVFISSHQTLEVQVL